MPDAPVAPLEPEDPEVPDAPVAPLEPEDPEVPLLPPPVPPVMVTVNCPEAVCVTVAPLNLILLTLLTEVVPSVTVNAVPPPPVVPEIMVVPPYKLIYQSS